MFINAKESRQKQVPANSAYGPSKKAVAEQKNFEEKLRRGGASKHLKADGQELHLSKKLSQVSVLARTEKIFQGGQATAPWVVELDPTSACNLVCPDCISGSLLNKGGFSGDRLLELGHELIDAGVRAVILIGGGEPLAHPKIGDLIKILGTGGVHIGITTNGTLIDRYLEVIAEHTSWLRVSVDAGTAETFQYFRPSPSGRSKFNHVIENMQGLASKMKRGKLGMSYLMLTELSSNQTVIRTNVHEIYEAAVLAREIGCDYFEVKPSYDMNHYLIGQPREILEDAVEQVEQIQSLETNNFKILQPSNLAKVLGNEPLIEPKNYNRCLVSELRTLITPNGSYICPYFRGIDNKRIGDVASQSFKDMWNGEERRQTMDITDPAKDCRFHCIRHSSNQILEEMAAGDFIPDGIDDFDFFI